jgi:DNA-binding transcriptional regulator YhcF (GntR family)
MSRAIADGEAAQGERLPPALDLATVLGVNKNTVIRALHILRDEVLLDFTRGRGVRVVGTPPSYEMAKSQMTNAMYPEMINQPDRLLRPRWAKARTRTRAVRTR